ncbi:phosphotransferase family protein [Pseudonocardia acaciae]|uniref:phosphotransferase family protein n=1 Tax=Pseudonocardia acaciae TaxID=551276 RepID=UPI001FDF5859|nr:aminoglycoside phosphotransferase family protein [Pseudonocardia acaciae]
MSFTEATATAALAAACRAVGLDTADASLIRIGSNAVFRLRAPVIVRIARDSGAMGEARRQIAVARWLENLDYPATRALPIDQPLNIDGHAATFWESASEKVEYAPIGDVASLICRLHRLPAPTTFTLPTYQPFKSLNERLSALTAGDPEDTEFLRTHAARLRAEYDNLKFKLAAGPIHGDANVGNVILSREGRPVLIDLDSFAHGPREWDLVQTALFYERFGWHTEEEYRTFAEIYGFDIMQWPGYPVLAGYRELSMTLWLAGKAEQDVAAAAEVHKRVEAIRTNGDRRDWTPF